MSSIVVNGVTLDTLLGKGAVGLGVYKYGEGQVAKLMAASNAGQDTNTDENMAMFREIGMLKALSHPNIVNVSEYFVSESTEGEHTITSIGVIMETLSLPLDKLLYSYSKITFKQVQSLTAQLFSAISYMINVNVVHRDIKPSNIMLSSDGRLKIIDFGGIKEYYDSTEATGTIFYKPPENVLGLEADEKTFDVWSAGCTVLELLTREPIFYAPAGEFYDLVEPPGEYQAEAVTERIVDCFRKDELAIPSKNQTNRYESDELYKFFMTLKKNKKNNVTNDKHKLTLLLNDQPTIVSAIEEEDSELFSLFLDFIVNKVMIFDSTKRLPIEEIINHGFINKFAIDVHPSDETKTAVKKVTSKSKLIDDSSVETLKETLEFLEE